MSLYGLNPDINKLEPIQANGSNCLKVCDKKTKMNHYTGKIKLMGSGASVYADSSPAPTSDNDDREGWLFTKTSTGSGKFNYYYYSEGNQALTLADLKNLKANVSIDDYQNSSSLPHFVVYTKMTGTGDAGSWYKSRVAYSISSGEKILPGERIEMWAKSKPESITQERQVEFNTVTTTGTGAETEEIMTIALSSDSAGAMNTKILVESMGAEFTDNIKVNYKLVNDSI